jgi:hypothetical protein
MSMVRSIVRDAGKQDYRFEAIVGGIVKSPAFQMRQLSPVPAPDTQQAALTGADKAR